MRTKMGGGWKPWVAQTTAVLVCAALAQAQNIVPHIEVLEGDGAINNIRLHHAKDPVVRVVDQDGHPIPNLAVTFLLPGTGAGGSFADGKSSLTVMTDENGQAAGQGLRPNSSAGPFQIRVTTSLAGQVATASISQTNAEPAQGGVSSKTIALLAILGGAAAAGAAVALGKGKSSAGGSSTTTSSTGVVITPGSPTITGP
jgi:hypothetical protein